MAVFLHLFHGRETLDEQMEDWGDDGPTFGPFDCVHVTYAETIRASSEGKPECWFDIREGCVWYDGLWYGDFTVSIMASLELEPFNKDKAEPPAS